MRREKGAAGVVRASSSSMAFSSMESELVERLARRRRAEGVVGEEPDRPSVVTESLRRWSFTAVDAKGVGKAVTGGCETELFLKRLAKALDVTDPCRCRAMSLGLVLVLGFSEDIVKESYQDG
jgi:hypothetical protein